MKWIVALALLAGSLWASDVTVVVKAVNMEVGQAAVASYNYHAMIVEVDGTMYKINRPFIRNETWLHKGTYTGRWKDSKKKKLQVDVPDDGKVKRVDFNVLAEE